MPPRRAITLTLLALCLFGAPASAQTTPAAAEKLFKSGKYDEVIDAANMAIGARQFDEQWYRLKIRAELATGRYADALKSFEFAGGRFDQSIALRLLAYDVYRMNDMLEEAEGMLVSIREVAARAPWRYSDPASRVVIARALLLAGADARQVLELFLDRAKKEDPSSPDPYYATGELALEKSDYALAAESYQNALKRDPENPDAHLGLARSFQNDPERVNEALTKALELNPRHVESILFQIDDLIDREDYAQTETLLKQVNEINPRHPDAWAYRAVLAHLVGDKEREQAHRAEAFKSWRTNPRVDHLIGVKLSQKYRFAEGSEYQRRALKFMPAYVPAKVQLCQDLLRLGKEDEGWRIAELVFKQDEYNVVAYNLVTLHENISKFRTIENEHFLLRMDGREADIYGDRVMALLMRSKDKLCAKYGLDLREKITVEIFPRQQDFAIRTFGLPGGAGFLGVCFGNVVTVNSPASQGATPSNWEAVLWHEFCHVVTLHKTRNKMPRWLSEGISVYEERGETPSWGQVMNPQYRDLVLTGGATPVSKLSGAFLRPPTPMHLQFAYYQSSMVVQYIVERFGIEALQRILTDLGSDVPINEALAKHTEPIDKLDESFAKWFREQAESLGSKDVNWDRPKLPLDADSEVMAEWVKENPTSFFGFLGLGRALIAEGKFKDAIEPLEKAAAMHPGYAEAGGPYLLLAAAYRGLHDVKAERAMLEKHAALDADSVELRMRLIELATTENDHAAVRKYAEQALAVNPLIPAPHRQLAHAAEALGDRALAIQSHRTLLQLDPLDRAEHHFQLARLFAADEQLPVARKEVVRALEEAPRFRAAHQLLLDIAGKMGETNPARAADAPRPPASPDAATTPTPTTTDTEVRQP